MISLEKYNSHYVVCYRRVLIWAWIFLCLLFTSSCWLRKMNGYWSQTQILVVCLWYINNLLLENVMPLYVIRWTDRVWKWFLTGSWQGAREGTDRAFALTLLSCTGTVVPYSLLVISCTSSYQKKLCGCRFFHESLIKLFTNFDHLKAS